MTKAMRKPRPSMPKWFWWYDWCHLCKCRHNCNQCKAARNWAKSGESLKRKDKRQMLKEGDMD